MCLRLPGSLVVLCIVGHRCYEGMMEKYESLRNPRKDFPMGGVEVGRESEIWKELR